MPTRQVESTHEAEPNHPVPEKGAAGVESPSAEQMQGANGLPRQSAADGVTAGPPRETNADDTDPGGDQDIDTAGTEADELSFSRAALGFPRSDDSLGAPQLGPSSDDGSPAKVL
jgi:hypothetical protein